MSRFSMTPVAATDRLVEPADPVQLDRQRFTARAGDALEDPLRGSQTGLNARQVWIGNVGTLHRGPSCEMPESINRVTLEALGAQRRAVSSGVR